MSNLKGSSFEKQIKNAKIRLEARGESRYLKQDQHLTHSNALALKRDNMLSSFADYATSLNRDETKLNQYMNDETITNFLKERTASLSAKSAENFTRGFSALINGLKNKGVSVNAHKKTFDTFVKTVKDTEQNNKNSCTQRDIKDLDTVLHKLNNINPSFSAIATLQSNLGVRVSEAIELYKNPDKYLNQDNTVQNLVGKGNHIYDPKPITKEIISILSNSSTVSYSSYQKALTSLNLTSHDFRYTYVKNRMEELLQNNNHESLKNNNHESLKNINSSYEKALRIISKEINHHRPIITQAYLSQTSF